MGILKSNCPDSSYKPYPYLLKGLNINNPKMIYKTDNQGNLFVGDFNMTISQNNHKNW